MAEWLLGAAADLTAASDDKAQVRKALLSLLCGEPGPERHAVLAGTFMALDPTATEPAPAQAAMLKKLTGTADLAEVLDLTQAIAQLAPTEETLAQARSALLSKLISEPDCRTVKNLAGALARLDPTPEDLARVRQTALTRLADQGNPFEICALAEAAGGLEPGGDGEPARVRGLEAALSMLPGETTEYLVQALAETAAALAVTEQERERVRGTLLGKLADTADDLVIETIAVVIDYLGVTELELAQARAALVTKLAGEASRDDSLIAGVLADLEPTATDLAGSRKWNQPPTPDLLASARQNSALSAWITSLPQLSITSDNT